MARPRWQLLLVVALAVGPAAVQGQETAEKIYVRASLGLAQWRTDCDGTTACDDSDQVAQIGAGYRLGDHIAAEAGLADVGKLRIANNELDVTLRARGLLLGAAWHFDVTPSIIASLRGGVVLLDVTQSVTSASQSGQQSGNHTEAYVGASGALRISPHFALELAIQFTRLQQDEQGLDLDGGRIGMITFGVRANF